MHCSAMMQRRHWFCVFLILSSHIIPQERHYAHALQIVSSTTTLQVVNGNARHRHVTTFQADQYDAETEGTFTVTDTSGKVRTVTVQAQPPELHYSQDLVGFVPKYMRTVSSKVCMVTLPSNTSVLREDNLDNARPNPFSTDFRGSANGAARRLLSRDTGKEFEVQADAFLGADGRPVNLDWAPRSDLYHSDKFRPSSFADVLESNTARSYDVRDEQHWRMVDAINDRIARKLEETTNTAQRKLLSIFNNKKGIDVFKDLGPIAAGYGFFKYGFPAIARMRSRIKKLPKEKATTNKAAARPIEEDGGSVEMSQIGPQTEAAEQAAITAGQAESSAVSAAETGAVGASEAASTDSMGAILLSEGGPALGEIGLAVAAGFAVSYVLGNLFGGHGGSNKAVANALTAIQHEIHNIADQLNTLTQWANSQQQFDQTVNNRFELQNDINRHLENEIAENTNAIAYLQGAVTRVANAINAVENQTITEFNAIGTQLNAVATSEIALWNATKDLHSETESQLRALINEVSKLAWSARSTNTDLIHTWRDTSMRRAIIKLFHRTVNSEELDPTQYQSSEPLLDFTGISPLDLTEFNKLKTPDGATSFGSVYIQRTAFTGGVYLAQVFNLTFVCDPLFILDNVVPGLNFQTVFQWLGPQNCLSATETGTWNCTCALKVESRQCELLSSPSDHLYPWKWGGATFMDPGPSADLDSMSEHCTSTTPSRVTTSDIAAGVTPGSGPEGVPGALTYPDGWLTTITEIETWLNLFCLDSKAYADPISGSKVRIHGDYWPRYTDLELDTVTTPLACDASFAAMFSGQDTHLRMAFSVYHVMTLNYLSNLDIKLGNLEQWVYGHVPSDLTYITDPFNSDSSSGQTYRCVSFVYLKVNPYTTGQCTPDPANLATKPGTNCPKVRLYRNRLEARSGRLIVKVDGTEITNSSAVAGTQEAQQTFLSKMLTPDTSGSAGDIVTMTSSLDIDIEGANALPNTFYRYDPWLGRTIGSDFVTYDVPFSMIGEGSPATSRMGKSNYFMQPWPLLKFQSLGHDEPYTLRVWKWIYQTTFDARFVGGSPHTFQRQLLQNPSPVITGLSNFDYFCNASYEEDGTTKKNAVINFDWCQILRWFTVESVVTDGAAADGQTGLIFRPRNYIYTGTVETPGGVWSSKISSHCPSAFSVVYIEAGPIEVILNSSSPDPTTVHVTALNETQDPSCDYGPVEVTFSEVQPQTVTIPYVAGCNPRFFQVKTLNNNATCYKFPGMPIGSSYSEGDENIPPAVQNAVSTVRDQAIDDIISQTNSVANISMEVQHISDTAANDAEIESRIDDLLQKRIDDINNMRTKENRNEQYVKKQIQDATEQLNKAKAQAKAARTDEASVNKLIDQMDNINKLGEKIFEVMMRELHKLNQENNDTQNYLPIMDAAIDKAVQALNDDNSGCGGGGGGLFSGILSPITGMLCGLFHWIENAIGSLLKALLPIILIAGIIFCVVECAPELCSCAGSLGGSAVKGVGGMFTHHGDTTTTTTRKIVYEQEPPPPPPAPVYTAYPGVVPAAAAGAVAVGAGAGAGAVAARRPLAPRKPKYKPPPPSFAEANAADDAPDVSDLSDVDEDGASDAESVRSEPEPERENTVRQRQRVRPRQRQHHRPRPRARPRAPSQNASAGSGETEMQPLLNEDSSTAGSWFTGGLPSD